MVRCGYNVLIIGNRCFRCGHEWVARNQKQKPTFCAKCRSALWDRKRRKNVTQK